MHDLRRGRLLDVDELTTDVGQGLDKEALAGATGADDEHRDLLFRVTAGGLVHDLRLVHAEIEGKVVALDRLLRVDTGPTLPHDELALFTTGDLVLDEQGQEVGVGEFLLHGLKVTDLQGVQDAGKKELFQMRRQLGDGIHGYTLHLAAKSSGKEKQQKFNTLCGNTKINKQKNPQQTPGV